MQIDVITAALQEVLIKEGKEMEDVKHYLRMRYRLEVDNLVLSKRLEKIKQSEKAVA
jgi:hypothetical protein